MTDPEIIALFFQRSEQAIEETKGKYGSYIRSVAGRILRDPRDAEEAVSDSYLALWSSIPPAEPKSLGAYAAKLCRAASIDKARNVSRKKRGGGEYDEALEELSSLASPNGDPERSVSERELTEAINGFLRELPEKKRVIFVRRWFYFMSAEEIARERLMSAAAVRMTLSRLRRELRERLIREELIDE